MTLTRKNLYIIFGLIAMAIILLLLYLTIAPAPIINNSASVVYP